MGLPVLSFTFRLATLYLIYLYSLFSHVDAHARPLEVFRPREFEDRPFDGGLEGGGGEGGGGLEGAFTSVSRPQLRVSASAFRCLIPYLPTPLPS